MIPPIFIYYLIGIICVISIVGAIILIHVVTWLTQSPALQSQSQSIKSLDEGRVYVELSALQQDEEGYFIPGYGRLLQTWENTDGDPLRQIPEVKTWKGKVAFICYDKTVAGSDIRQYVIGSIVPL